MSGTGLAGSGFQNFTNNNTNNANISDDPNSSDNVKPVSIFSNDYKK